MVHGTSIDIVEVMHLSVIHTEVGDPAIFHPEILLFYNYITQMIKCYHIQGCLHCHNYIIIIFYGIISLITSY